LLYFVTGSRRKRLPIAVLGINLDIYTHALDKNKKAASDKLHNALEI